MKASLRVKGEAREPRPPARVPAQRQTPMLPARAWAETSGMVGDRMVGSWGDVKWGSPAGSSDGVHGSQEPEEPCPEGDRASVGAKKRGNARGAKGGRDVAAAERRTSLQTDVVPPRGLFASGLEWSASAPSNGSAQAPSWSIASIAWKAGCGKSASPVWEGGHVQPVSLPHRPPLIPLSVPASPA